MSDIVNKHILTDLSSSLSECLKSKQYNLGILLGKIGSQTHFDNRFYPLFSELLEKCPKGEEGEEEVEIEEGSPLRDSGSATSEQNDEVVSDTSRSSSEEVKKYKVKLLCNWADSKILANTWNKMSKGNYTWDNITLVWDEEPDYFVILNCPPINQFPDPKKSILFRMEPNMDKHPELWGFYSNPDPDDYIKVCGHDTEYNNNEWHLSKTYTELMTEEIEKDSSLDTVVSTVLSKKYKDPGQILRVNFAKFMDDKMLFHIFGDNKFEYKNYKGSLPYHCKDKALFPYKYTFNAENNSVNNYYTEKLIDGILAECLVFYWGPPNIRDLIDERAYVQLDLINFEEEYEKVKLAIKDDWWSKRIEYIREEKRRILTELQFFPRLKRIIDGYDPKTFKSSVDIVSQEDYQKIVEKNKVHFDRLKEIVGEKTSGIEENPGSEEQQRNIYSFAQRSNKILNIGVKGGESTLIMLLANDKAKIHCFDLCKHVYTEPIIEYLNKEFENRVTLVKGSSRDTLAQYRDNLFDLFHIDGSHQHLDANLDFFNCKSMAHKESVVIMNNMTNKEHRAFWNGYIRDGFIRPVHALETTGTNQHLVGRYIK